MEKNGFIRGSSAAEKVLCHWQFLMRTHWGNFTLRTCPTRQHSSMVTSTRQSLETGKHTWSSPELSGYRLSDPFKTPKLCSLRLVARYALSPVFSRSTADFFYSENYAAACNRRDPIRLRSITFFNRFPCCFYDGRQFCPIGDVGGVPKARILRQWWMAKGGSSVSVFSPLQGGVPPWGRVFSRRTCLQIARDG